MPRFPFVCSRRRLHARDWWAYFGSFGDDDLFGDDAFDQDLDEPAGPADREFQTVPDLSERSGNSDVRWN